MLGDHRRPYFQRSAPLDRGAGVVGPEASVVWYAYKSYR